MDLFLNSVLLHESVRMRVKPAWSWSVVKRDGQCISLLRCITNTTPLVAENITQYLRVPVGLEFGDSPVVLCSRLHKAVVQVSARLGSFLKFWILFGVPGYQQKISSLWSQNWGLCFLAGYLIGSGLSSQSSLGGLLIFKTSNEDHPSSLTAPILQISSP